MYIRTFVMMPKQVMDLLACLNRGVGRCWTAVIWEAIPQCITWTTWWERNLRTFKGEEHYIIELNRFFSCLLCLIGWLQWPVFLSPPFLSFYICILLLNVLFPLVHILCTIGRNRLYASYLLLIKFFTYKN